MVSSPSLGKVPLRLVTLEAVSHLLEVAPQEGGPVVQVLQAAPPPQEPLPVDLVLGLAQARTPRFVRPLAVRLWAVGVAGAGVTPAARIAPGLTPGAITWLTALVVARRRTAVDHAPLRRLLEGQGRHHRQLEHGASAGVRARISCLPIHSVYAGGTAWVNSSCTIQSIPIASRAAATSPMAPVTVAHPLALTFPRPGPCLLIRSRWRGWSGRNSRWLISKSRCRYTFRPNMAPHNSTEKPSGAPGTFSTIQGRPIKSRRSRTGSIRSGCIPSRPRREGVIVL